MCKIDASFVIEKPRKNFTSESSVFKKELKALLESLGQNVCICFQRLFKKLETTFISQEPNFIRCIKPNDLQQADFFDDSFVTAQLQNTGTVYLIENSDNVKIRK